MLILSYRHILLMGMCSALLSCVSAPQTAQLMSTIDADEQHHVYIENVPFFPQEEYQCGPAALATVLGFNGSEISLQQLVDEVYLPARQGSFQLEMVASARSHGHLVYPLEPSLSHLLDEVKAGSPVLVLQNLGLSVKPQWHFAVVKGYDLEREKILMNSGTFEDYSLSLTTFERTWARAQYWAVVAPKAGNLPATATVEKYFTSLVELEHSYPNFDVLELAYKGGIEKWHTDHHLQMGYANLLLDAGKLSRAAETYQHITARYPTYSPALNNLAHVMFLLGDGEIAMNYAKQAIDNAESYRNIYLQTYEEIAASVAP